MCQRCVDRGLITPEQLKRLESGEDIEAVLGTEGVALYIKAMDEDPESFLAGGVLADGGVVTIGMDDAPDFLKRMFGKAATPKTPDETATETMDNAMTTILDWYRDRRAMAGSAFGVTEEALAAPHAMHTIAEGLAGEAMFRTSPATVAYSLLVMTARYDRLLAEWAELYTRMAKDVDEDGLNLDAATTPESKLAVTKISEKAGEEHRPGMYL